MPDPNAEFVGALFVIGFCGLIGAAVLLVAGWIVSASTGSSKAR